MVLRVRQRLRKEKHGDCGRHCRLPPRQPFPSCSSLTEPLFYSGVQYSEEWTPVLAQEEVLVNKANDGVSTSLASPPFRRRQPTRTWAMRPEGRSVGSSCEGFSHSREGGTRRLDLFPLLLLLHLDVMPGAAAAIWNMKEACIRVKVKMAELTRQESRYSVTSWDL